MSARTPLAHRASPNALLRAALLLGCLLVVFGPGAHGVAASAAWNAQPHPLDSLFVVRQTSANSCGPAALATLSTWLGEPRSEAELVALTALGPAGISLSEFARLAHHIGLAGTWYRVTASQLNLVPTPFVAHLESSSEQGHLVAVADVSYGYVAVADPAEGARALALSSFADRFSGRVFVLDQLP